MRRGIRWLSVGAGSGYGNASLDYRRGLQAAGIEVGWTPLGSPSPFWQAELGPVETDDAAGREGAGRPDPTGRLVEHDTVVVHSSPLWHEQLGKEAAGKLLVAYTTWETDRLPAEWVAILGRYERVIVPSRFNAEVFASSGVTTPIEIVPHVAPAPQPVAGCGDDRRRGDSRFVFYLIAPWTSRKAILDAVEAYVSAFDSSDDVLLVIHTTPVDLVARFCPTWFTLARALAGRSRLPEIELSTRSLPRSGIDALHRRGDCFVNLSRGEGWGLGAFEAAAYGRPAIATRWGATPEFLPPGYPYLVDYDLVATTDDPPDAWWEPRAGERWAKARVAHAASLLRRVRDDQDEARRWGALAQSHVLARFGSKAVTGRLLEALRMEAEPGGGPLARCTLRAGSGALAPAASSPGAPHGGESYLGAVTADARATPARSAGEVTAGAGRSAVSRAGDGEGNVATTALPAACGGLELNETDDGVIIYDERTDRVHHLNPSAAAILALCDGTRSPEQLAGELAELFGLEDPPLDATRSCLEDLRRERLID